MYFQADVNRVLIAYAEAVCCGSITVYPRVGVGILPHQQSRDLKPSFAPIKGPNYFNS